jgi:hypothetical protein
LITVSETNNQWNEVFCHNNMSCQDKPPYGYDYKLGWWTSDRTFTFSSPVRDPILAVFSLARSGTPITISSSVAAQVYCNSCTGDPCLASSYSNGIHQINSNTIESEEGFGIILFPGTHSSITISLTSNTDDGSYKWGLSCPPVTTTEEPTTTAGPL